VGTKPRAVFNGKETRIFRFRSRQDSFDIAEIKETANFRGKKRV
jgi:hypothetical protein